MNSTTNSAKHVEGFEDTVRDFWASRPRRPAHGRKLAGVASAVGRRYGIDPVVVRVALIVMAIFGGIGLSLYLLGWLLLPAENDEVSGLEGLVGKGRSSMSKALALVLCVVLLPVSTWAFAGNWFEGGGFLGLTLVLTALYLLHRSRGHLNRPPAPTPTTHTAYSAYSAHPDGTAASPVSQAPPTWDPLGAAPLAWRLPDPAPAPSSSPQPSPPRRKSKIGFAVFGVALMVGGVGAALAVEGEPWFTPAHVVGLVLAVLGTGMVVGSFLGGGRGLIWLAVPLSLVGLTLSTVSVPNFSGGLGDLQARPETAQQVQPVYERTAGNIRLDLSQLDGSQPVRTTVRNGAGNVTVLLPDHVDVRYSCRTTMGVVECFGREQVGVNAPAITGVDHGADGEGGQRITLTVTSAAGHVEVHRG